MKLVKSKLYRICAVVVAFSVFGAIIASPSAAAQVTTDESVVASASTLSVLPARQAEEFGAATWELFTTSEGVPQRFSTQVTASADIDELVVDVYLNGTLIDSQLDPDSITVDLVEAGLEDANGATISLIGREVSSEQCERIDGVISFRNTTVLRTPHSPAELADSLRVSVTGANAVEVANVAAAAERAMLLPDATVAVDAPVAIDVGSATNDDILTADVAGMIDQRHFSVSTIAAEADANLRTVQRTSVDLDRTGGATFVSATGFGGRVGDVDLAGEINLTPLAEGGGFAVEVNDRVVISGEVDENGQGAFNTTVTDWPRDARINVRLVLTEDRTPCSEPAAGFAGTANLELVPVATSFDDPDLGDFPQALLETASIALYVDDDVPAEWVAVTAAALQDTSVEPLRFSDASDAANATLRLTTGSGNVAVIGGTLTMPLNEDTVTQLETERFWTVGLDADPIQTSISTDDDAVSVAPSGLSAPRAGWIVTVAIAAAAVAVLLLFRRNSEQAP